MCVMVMVVEADDDDDVGVWVLRGGAAERMQPRRGLFACGDEDKGEKGEGISEGSGGWSVEQGQVKQVKERDEGEDSQMAAALALAPFGV